MLVRIFFLKISRSFIYPNILLQNNDVIPAKDRPIQWVQFKKLDPGNYFILVNLGFFIMFWGGQFYLHGWGRDLTEILSYFIVSFNGPERYSRY